MPNIGIKLKVMEAVQDDVNKGIVKIDSSFMKQIGVTIGDIVEIKGERSTAAIVDRAYPGDIGLNIIRMDGNIRRNAKTSIGEVVTVTKAEVKPAKKVSVAPAHKGVMIKASPELFKQGLLGKALVKGDVVSLGRASRKRYDQHGREITDIFSMMEQQFAGFGFGDLKFVVVDTNPKKEIVVVTPETEVEFNSQAVELKEEEESGASLGINYEDIGGLKEEIRKVQEMVELPLRHPEIFEKLGIEAPKGLLLYGPPGTGKTLLAKAVASETNSHFILINGPEVISKFYGESLPYDEKVLVRKDGLIQRLKIGEIVENQWSVDIVCFNKENKIIFKKVDQFIKHPSTNKIYRVRTKSGRNIRVTADHNLFTLGDKGIESVKTSDLQPKKSFIVVPQRLPCLGMLYVLDLLDQLSKEDYGLMVQNVSEYLKEAVKKIGLKECARELGVKTKYCYDLRSKNIGIRASKFVALMNKAGIKINKQTLQIGTKRNWLPAMLPLNEDLIHFFGWWMAEGSYTQGAVRVSLHCNELNYMFSLAQRLFGTAAIYHKKNSFGADVFINSTVLKIVMEKVIGFVSGSAKKHVPTIIFNLDKDRIAAFLRGYFSGDGSVNSHGRAPQVEVSSASHCLIDDVCYLLLHFGIVAKIYDKPSENSKRLTFASFDNLNKFREIGFVDNNRNKLIYDYINTSKFSRESQLPLTGQLARLVQSHSRFSAWKNSRSIGSTVVAECLPEVSNALALGDLAFDMVQEITEEEQPEFVYDLSVSYDHNFLAGFGGIFAHNSEANLRKKFEEAEQNAPSIIFFDEIDAIATKREEAKGDVEKRVVAQLLGLMDGLKSRGKVIVIAATNMPQLLDPALRRPGRFDREIEIGVPDKEGRLEILQIHSRNMPIEGSLYPDVVKKLIPLVIDEALNSYPLKIKESEDEIRLLNENIAKIKNEINAKQTTIKSLTVKIEETKNNIELKQKDLLDIQQKMAALEERKQKADENMIVRIIQALKGLTSDINMLNNEIQRKKQDISELINELNNLKKDIDTKGAEIEISSAKILEYTSSINNLQKNISNLERLKKELESVDVPKLMAFVEEIIALDSVSQNFALDDPRRAINENKKSDWYKELDSCGLLEPIKRKARQDKKSIYRDLESIARITHGFVGADISALSKEAAMIVLRRILPDIKLEGKADDATPFSKDILEKLVIKLDDFQEALKTVRPSAMREVFVEKPDVSWKDVGGLDEVKNKIKEAVEWPLKNPEMFKRMGIRPPRGILLWGPPGTGKTMLAKAVAKESEANFILINGPSLLSKWVGESEKAVREIFRKARQTAPTIMFFDEIDALFSRRGSNEGEGGRVSDKLVNQMLSEMDGLESLHDVVIIGASNRPILIDPALLRQGRFDRIIYTPVPDEESRKMIFEVHLSRVALDLASFKKEGDKSEIKNKVGKVSKTKKADEKAGMGSESNGTVVNGMELGKKEIVSQLSQELAKKTEGYVGADIEGVCREAAMIALREDFNIRGVKKEHFIKALEAVPPSIDKETEEAYKELKNYFSSARAKQVKEEKAGYVG